MTIRTLRVLLVVALIVREAYPKLFARVKRTPDLALYDLALHDIAIGNAVMIGSGDDTPDRRAHLEFIWEEQRRRGRCEPTRWRV